MTDDAPGLCLSVRQPWAMALVVGRKPVENRSWSTTWLDTAVPRWVYIHASGRPARLANHEQSALNIRWPSMPAVRDMPMGAILGACRFIGQQKPGSPHLPDHSIPWATGPLCWIVGRAVAFVEPVPARGRLGLWKPPEDAREALAEQWATAVEHVRGRPV